MSTQPTEDFDRVNAAAHMAISAATDYILGHDHAAHVMETAAREHIRGIDSALADGIRDLLGSMEIGRLKSLDAAARAAHGA